MEPPFADFQEEGDSRGGIVPRAVPVMEAMTALVLADLYLEAKLNRMS